MVRIGKKQCALLFWLIPLFNLCACGVHDSVTSPKTQVPALKPAQTPSKKGTPIGATSATANTEPQSGAPRAVNDDRAICDGFRIRRGNCPMSAPDWAHSVADHAKWFSGETATMMSRCRMVTQVFEPSTAGAILDCLKDRTDKDVCGSDPLNTCVVQTLRRVIAARTGRKWFEVTRAECRDLGQVCGSQPVTHNTNLCDAIDWEFVAPYRNYFRACLSWFCDNAMCVDRVLSLATRVSLGQPATPDDDCTDPELMKRENMEGICAEKAGYIRTVRPNVQQMVDEVPIYDSGFHMFLWYLDEPPATEYLKECQGIEQTCIALRLKPRAVEQLRRARKVPTSTHFPLNLTQRACRTALWSVQPKYTNELQRCLATLCNEAFCLEQLARGRAQ